MGCLQKQRFLIWLCWHVISCTSNWCTSYYSYQHDVMFLFRKITHSTAILCFELKKVELLLSPSGYSKWKQNRRATNRYLWRVLATIRSFDQIFFATIFPRAVRRCFRNHSDADPEILHCFPREPRQYVFFVFFPLPGVPPFWFSLFLPIRNILGAPARPHNRDPLTKDQSECFFLYVWVSVSNLPYNSITNTLTHARKIACPDQGPLWRFSLIMQNQNVFARARPYDRLIEMPLPRTTLISRA